MGGLHDWILMGSTHDRRHADDGDALARGLCIPETVKVAQLPPNQPTTKVNHDH